VLQCCSHFRSFRVLQSLPQLPRAAVTSAASACCSHFRSFRVLQSLPRLPRAAVTSAASARCSHLRSFRVLQSLPRLPRAAVTSAASAHCRKPHIAESRTLQKAAHCRKPRVAESRNQFGWFRQTELPTGVNLILCWLAHLTHVALDVAPTAADAVFTGHMMHVVEPSFAA
jgi:hypothetical protein